MIDLIVKDDRQGRAIEMLLATERIPYRHWNAGCVEQPALLLVGTPDVSDVVVKMAKQRRTLIIGELPKGLCGIFADSQRETVLRSGQCTWCTLPLGETLATTLTEGCKQHPRQGMTPHIAQQLYYQLPEWLRMRRKRSAHQQREEELAQRKNRSEYPVDDSGQELSKLFLSLIRQSAGWLVRLGRWPAPYHSAATLTHDVEPSAYSHRRGLSQLLQVAAQSGHVPSLGLVSKAAREYVGKRFPFTDLRVYCYGQQHRGEAVTGSRDQIAGVLREAKFRLEQMTGSEVRGFRSACLERSTDLFQALSESGFAYSSSCPDVDRESKSNYGGGVRWNLPFRPLLEGSDGHFLFSDCLELPVSAPNCIEPLLCGESTDALRQAIRDKIDFVAKNGLMYIGVVRPGAFGDSDSDRCMDQLRFVVKELERKGAWLTTMDEIASWWMRREQVQLTISDGCCVAKNKGDHEVEDLRLVIEDEQGRVTGNIDLPVLVAGGTVRVELSEYMKSGAMRYASSI